MDKRTYENVVCTSRNPAASTTSQAITCLLCEDPLCGPEDAQSPSLETPGCQQSSEQMNSCFFRQGPHYVATLRKATQVPTISPEPSLRWLPSSFSSFLSTEWVFIQTSEFTYYKTENMKQRAEAGEDSKMIQKVQVLELGRVEQTLKLQLTINNPVWWWYKSCDFP